MMTGFEGVCSSLARGDTVIYMKTISLGLVGYTSFHRSAKDQDKLYWETAVAIQHGWIFKGVK
jgi:hypothetical protein